MSVMDFSNAQLPALRPLAASYTENEIEADLQKLVLDLFASTMAEDVFDSSVLGAAHLGSFDLVRRAITADGLILIPGSRQEPATRYLYRAWRAANVQGRGLHFLRTYLQLLFPGAHSVSQMLQDKALPYPTALTPYDGVTVPPDKYLTSRLEIAIQVSENVQAVPEVVACVLSVVPARFVVYFNISSTSQTEVVSAVCFSGYSLLNSYGIMSEPGQASSPFTLGTSVLGEIDTLGV